MATIHYEKDSDPGALQGQRVAVLGYGSQGHAHSLNLRDSGHDVRVGLREGSKSWAAAEEAGLRVLPTAEAAREADVVMMLMPDTAQAVLCGGVTSLLTSGFQTLVEAGYQPEVAYFECLHELKLIVDLIYEGGLAGMRYSVSDTAEYGDYTRGPRVVDERTREEMRRILGEIRSGEFAKEWVLEARAGYPKFEALRAAGREQSIEEVGKGLRSMMPWLHRDGDPDAR